MPEESGTVRLIRVFVSSPGDVDKERRVLDDVVQAVNSDVGEDYSVFLKLQRWEKDVVPQIGPPPQKVIYGQMPPPDIYLGIMSSRFGTPTEGRGSGTEHEFREALKRWRKKGKPWILFYFNEEVPHFRTTAEIEEYLKVRKFRDELQSLGILGRYEGVQGGSSSLREQVGQHLRKIITRYLPEILSVGEAEDQVTPGSGKGPSRRKRPVPRKKTPRKAPAVPKAYREWLCSECSEIGLLGLEPKEAHSFRLSHVYVPLSTQAGEKRGTGEKRGAGEKRRGRTEPDPESLIREGEGKPRLLLDLLGKESLYVPGAPGSGKSTFCRWVAWLTCTGAMPSYFSDAAELPKGHEETFPETLRGRFPVLIRLREFWPYLPTRSGCREMSQAELEKAMSCWFEEKTPGEIEWTGDAGWTDVEAHLEQGSALLILDGADEIPLSGDGRRPCSPREMLLSGLAEAVPSWTKKGNRVLLTSRPYGLSAQESRKLDLRRAPIVELARPVQDLLVRRWFAILEDDASKARETTQGMISHIREREDIESLASNPMLLTAMCIVYSEGKRLPKDKHDLYTRIVDNVLYNRFPRDPILKDLVRNRLAVIAYGMHTGAGLGEERSTPLAEVTNDEIDKILQEYQKQTPHTETAFRSAVEARDQMLSESGLLLPGGEDHAGFYHLSFQEFLAAQRLLDLEQDRLPKAFRDRAPVPEWRNTLSFVFSSLAKFSADRSTGLVGGLVREVSRDTLGLHVVVADCLEILLGKGIRLSKDLEEKFRKDCLDAIEREVSILERVHLGLVLGQIGDTRIVIDLRDQAAYVEIPAGRYVFGDDRKSFNVKKRFLLSRYPVTNSQYDLFMRERGYENRDWWSDEGWKWRKTGDICEPEYWGAGKLNGPTQPVVGVSFYEAEAFARWAGGRLPTEREWEAAARGPEGSVYPWGNDWEDGICNSEESGVHATTPVGLFPRARSRPFGLEDMAGNVWEWCADYDDRKRSGVSSVLRGGSWFTDSRYLRSALRGWGDPGGRDVYIGFRVVLLVGVRTP